MSNNLSLQSSAPDRCWVSELVVTNFRNYTNLRLDVGCEPIVLTGANGAGKTNILEAISFLSPGRGLRNAKLDEVDHNDGQQCYGWGVAATVQNTNDEVHIGTGRDVANESNKRVVKIDGDKIRGQAELARVFSVMWQTPQMDGLFIGGASERRKFLDRLVYNFDAEHASRVYAYEHTMRERAKLLQGNADGHWLEVLEAKMAEKSVAIAAARQESIGILQQSIDQAPTAFPKALIAVDGQVENLLAKDMAALEVEQHVKTMLCDARQHDAITGRTSVGTHRSDFVVVHQDKTMPAASCSTGEQKALLLSIILAEARAKALWKHSVPVLLLDEVVAHLDEVRRMSLFEELLAMGAQTWLTGTDTSLFDSLKGQAIFLAVHNAIVA